jgi:prepilin-type N-terminal cleavage/methylation domain-containing protein
MRKSAPREHRIPTSQSGATDASLFLEASIKLSSSPQRSVRSSGFSLIELVMVLLLFSALTAVATSLIVESHKSLQNRLISSSLSDTATTSLSQIAREVRMAGYPSARCFSQSAVSSHPGIIAVPFVSISPYELVFEADLNGDGQVERIEYVLPPGSTSLIRSLTPKNPDGSLAVSSTISTTVLANLHNQLQGQPLFTWDIDPSNSSPFPQNIRTVCINAILQSSGGQSGLPVSANLTATCQRLNP